MLRTNRDITRDLEQIIQCFIKCQPGLNKRSPQEQNELVKTLSLVLKQKLDKKGGQLFMNDMTPEFMKSLNHNLVKGTQLFDKLNKVLQKHGLLDKNGQLDVQKLMNLAPNQKKELKDDLKNSLQQFLKNDLKLTPEPGKKNADELAEQMTNGLGNQADPYVNLLGLLNSRVSGSIPAVVQCFLGNGLNIDDVNPDHGMAQIDQFERAATGNAPDAGSELVDAFMQGLQQQNLAPSTSPRPSHGGQ